jgi:hypothetical protein
MKKIENRYIIVCALALNFVTAVDLPEKYLTGVKAQGGE